ncbi:hypothetical protein HZB02_01040 [Candidatus Woesearchaeota archaeon]|nr:hypothetical protein [Candidatus Woesearchaeota archaeon]
MVWVIVCFLLFAANALAQGCCLNPQNPANACQPAADQSQCTIGYYTDFPSGYISCNNPGDQQSVCNEQGMCLKPTERTCLSATRIGCTPNVADGDFDRDGPIIFFKGKTPQNLPLECTPGCCCTPTSATAGVTAAFCTAQAPGQSVIHNPDPAYASQQSCQAYCNQPGQSPSGNQSTGNQTPNGTQPPTPTSCLQITTTTDCKGASGQLLGCFWCPASNACVQNCGTGTCPGFLTLNYGDHECKSQCGNNIDDDNDGKTDYPEDLCCSSTSGLSETGACCEANAQPPTYTITPACTINDAPITLFFTANPATCGSQVEHMTLQRSPQFQNNPAGKTLAPTATAFNDDETVMGTSYTYTLTVSMRNGKTSTTTKRVTTAPELCKSTGTNPFCADASLTGVGNAQGAKCEARLSTGMCGEIVSYGTPCSSNQACASTSNGQGVMCKNIPSESCSYLQDGNPFEMYISSALCLGTQNSPNACFYDLTNTVVNGCYSCLATTTCFDYNSKDACSKNNCGLAGGSDACSWTTTNGILGKGICAPKQPYEGTDRCESFNTVPLMNLSKQDCRSLGKCIFDSNDKLCKACTGAEDCRTYTDKVSCEGNNQPIKSLNPDATCPVPYANSKDTCGVGFCKWQGSADSGICVKGEPASINPACAAGDVDCYQDLKPPTTDIPIPVDTLGPTNAVLTVTKEEGATVYYGIFCNQTKLPTANHDAAFPYTCPSTPLSMDTIDLSLLAATQNMQGECALSYFSVDEHQTYEQFKEITIPIDFKAPGMESFTNTTRRDDGNTLDIGIEYVINETATCTDTLIEPTGAIQNPSQYLSTGDRTTPQVRFNAEIRNLPKRDTTYQYKVTCTDKAGNVLYITKPIVVDSSGLIIAASPQEVTLNSTSVLINATLLSPPGMTQCSIDTTALVPSSSSGMVTPEYYYTKTMTMPNGINTKTIICNVQVNSQTKTGQRTLHFGVDTLPPSIAAGMRDEQQSFILLDSVHTYGIGKFKDVELNCSDNPIVPAGSSVGSFGCNQILSWICPHGSSCTAPVAGSSISASALNQYGVNFTIYYNGTDLGGNAMPTRSVLVHVAQAPQVKITIYGAQNNELTDPGRSYSLQVSSDTAFPNTGVALKYTFRDYLGVRKEVAVPLVENGENQWRGSLSIAGPAYASLNHKTATFTFEAINPDTRLEAEITEGAQFYITTDNLPPDDPLITITS